MDEKDNFLRAKATKTIHALQYAHHYTVFIFEIRAGDMREICKANQGGSLEMAAASKLFVKDFQKQILRLRKQYHQLLDLQYMIAGVEKRAKELKDGVL